MNNKFQRFTETAAVSHFWPGDIIELRSHTGSSDMVTLHTVVEYEVRGGAVPSASIRFSYTENPNGCDWRGFIELDGPDRPHLVARGIGHTRTEVHSLLPALKKWTSATQ